MTGDDAVGRIGHELDAANRAHSDVYSMMVGAGALDAATRESAIQAIASVATLLRSLAPSLSTLDALPESDQVRLAVVLLRVLTDSMSVALADTPEQQLMVTPGEVEELVHEVQVAMAQGPP